MTDSDKSSRKQDKTIPNLDEKEHLRSPPSKPAEIPADHEPKTLGNASSFSSSVDSKQKAQLESGDKASSSLSSSLSLTAKELPEKESFSLSQANEIIHYFLQQKGLLHPIRLSILLILEKHGVLEPLEMAVVRKVLNVTWGSLGHHVHLLEKHHYLRLFQRFTREGSLRTYLALTPEGQQALMNLRSYLTSSDQ